MSSYYLPDITGSNPKYLQVNQPINVYRIGMKYTFQNSPVFLDSLRLVLTDGSSSLLQKDVDWYVDLNTDVDDTAMSRAFLENPNFNKTLVKSITFSSNRVVGKRVAVNFQQFYLTQPGLSYDDGTPLEVTPDLIKFLVSSVADLKQQVINVTPPTAPNDQIPVLLPFDLNKERSGNFVSQEIITLNTVSGAKVLRLSRGAFFADSVSIDYNGTRLNPQTDYLPILVSPLTKQTANISGIYQAILVTKELTGPVSVSYHAVGGEVQLGDVNAVYNQLLAIKTYLQNQIFVTPDSIQQTPTFQSFNTRLTSLENNMRSVLSGAPTYGDATSGQVVKRSIATNDANFHWWTIATLYKVQGSTDVVTADQFRGRVFFPGSKIALSFIVDVNLNQTIEPVSFTTESLVFNPNYNLFTDLSVAAPVYPMLRVVYSNQSQSLAGAALQIGLPLVNLLDQMVVEDLSSVESCWLLTKTNQIITGSPVPTPGAPLDDNFLLPDGSTLWSSATLSSSQKIYVPKYNKGYLAYTGSTTSLVAITTSSDTSQLFSVSLPSYFPLSEISSVVVTFSSSDSNFVYDVEIPTPYLNNGLKRGTRVFVDTSNALQFNLLASLRKNNLNNILLSLNATALGNTNQSPLTDLVRYVRVRV